MSHENDTCIHCGNTFAPRELREIYSNVNGTKYIHLNCLERSKEILDDQLTGQEG